MAMNYGKIENGAVTLWQSGSKEGFYPIVLTPKPNEVIAEGYHYESYWEQRTDEIVEVWKVDEDMPTDFEALSILLGGAE